MFGTFKPVAFEPYGRRRARGRPPRWLVLLLAGAAAGAAGVLLVQERYLPPRLSASESSALRAAYDTAESERQRLAGELAGTTQRLQTTLAEHKSLTEALAASRTTAEQLRIDVDALVGALPPDPRGGAVEVRAARFSADQGALAYEVVLARPRAGDKPLTGVMQLAVTGVSAQGRDTTVNLQPVALSMGRHESLRGSVPLPAGFKPQQATVSVLDRAEGKLLGRRVLYVK